MAATQELSQQYAQLLKRLPGVYAAQVRLDASGQLAEVHLLAGSGRHPKQVVRDARTALLSTFDLDVDYQKISVAQLSDALGESMGKTEPALPSVSRLRCGGFEQSLIDDHYTVRVMLTDQDNVYRGSAVTHNSALQRQRAIAEAVLDAVHQYLGTDQRVFSLLAVQRIVSMPIPVVIVLVECLAPHYTTVLVGATESTEHETLCIQKATLDALNRKLPLLSASSSEGS